MNHLKSRLVSDEANNLQIRTTRGIYVDLNTKWRLPYHLSYNSLFYLITDGDGILCVNGQTMHMTPGNIYFIPKGSMFSAECPHTLSKIYFTTQVFNQYHQEIDIASDECIILEQRGAEIEQIKSLLSNNDFLSAVHLRLIFEKLVLEILEKTDTNYQLQRLPRQTKIILRIIAQAPHMSMTNSFFAEATESSLSLVQKQFRAEIGTSIQKYLKDKVLTLAANELISSSVSIKEISEKYGFCDQFYFSRLFTAHFGITPSQYRKNNKMY